MISDHQIFELTKEQRECHKAQIKAIVVEILKEQKAYHKEQIKIINSTLKKLGALQKRKYTKRKK